MAPLQRLHQNQRRSGRLAPAIPRLENGDQLTREEFERRYEASPRGVKAELIDGVVYMASPTRLSHGRGHGLVTTWLGLYASQTRGSEMLPETTTRLGPSDEPEPDAVLRVLPAAGGLSRDEEDDYLAGPVELVVEVAGSSTARDLHKKKDAYARSGVLEYLVVVVQQEEVLWFVRDESGYVALTPDRRGILRSRVFPGLWLDTAALLATDVTKLLATLERGLASKPHQTFARELAKRITAKRRRRR